MPAYAGLGIFFGIIMTVVQIAIVFYFFIMFNRLIQAVERIERRIMEIESAITTQH